jgi:UPF0042 nucleotide-binding protein
MEERTNFLVITGLSGAGKSLASSFFEDMGFFCIDNLPTILIPKLGQLFSQEWSKIRNVVLVVDIREREFLSSLFENLQMLLKMGITYKILFLEADDETLMVRFKETRRRHPLGNEERISEYINREREELLEKADFIIDTSSLTPNSFKERLKEIYTLISGKKAKMTIQLLSFGYKYGIPHDADLVIDVRFLPNPHYIEDLDPLLGEDERVINYIMKFEVSKNFFEKFTQLIDFLIPQYIKEGKPYLTIAIGCTGGKHRSIAFIKLLKDFINSKDYEINLVTKYRDVEKHA